MMRSSISVSSFCVSTERNPNARVHLLLTLVVRGDTDHGMYRAFNITPQRWLTQKRLELAHYQIRERKKKPSEVYIEVGFENLSHFTYAFKKHFGYAPVK